MSEATAAIRIDIVASGAEAGAKRVNASLDSIMRRAGLGSAANDNHAQSVRRLGDAMLGTANSGGVLNRNFGTLAQSGAALTGRLGSLNGALGGLALAGASAGVLALAGAFTAAGAAAAKYQDVLAKISTNVDTTTFNMDALSAGILRQSAAFGGMPVEEAEAAYDIISAGASSAAQTLDILKSSNELAVGGMTTIGVAADGLTSILNSYAATGLTAAQASDAIFISARDGKTTIDQLSASVGQVAPLAATMGVSFDEVAGSLAVLTKGGIKTAESVTGIKAILSSIAKPSEEAKKAAQSIGLEFNVAALKAKGLRGVLQDMADKTGGSTAKMAVLLGGVEALVPALALTANKGEEFATTMDHMASKAGATAEAVKKMQDGSPSFQWDRVVTAATAELIKLGQTIASAALPVMRLLADNMETIFRVGKAAAAGLLAFGAAAAAMKLSSAVGEVIALQRALGATGTFSALFGAGMKIAQAGVNGLTTAIAANPIGLIAVALTATIALLYQFRDAIMISSDGVTSLGDFFRAIFESIGPAITTAKNAITGALSSIWDGIKAVFGGVGSFLYSSFSVPLDAISGLFSSTFGDLDLTFEGVVTGAARVADLLVGVFRGSFSAIVALWNGLPAALGPNIMGIVNGAKSLISGFVSGITKIWQALVAFGQSAATTIASVFNAVGSFIERWANKAIAGINLLISGANKLGASIAPLADIKVGKIDPPKAPASGFAKLGQDVGAAFNSGFGNEIENGVKGLFGHARAIGAARAGTGAGSGGAARPTVPGVTDDSGFADPSKGKASGAQREAERRAKAEAEFWQTLQNEVATAKLLPLAAEDHRKELELQKILGRDLTAGEKARVDSLMQEVRTAKAVTAARDTHVKAVRANAQEQELLAKRQAGMTIEQAEIERKVLAQRNADQDAGVNILDETYRRTEAQLRLDLEGAAAIEKKNKLLDDQIAKLAELTRTGSQYGKDALRDYGSVAQRRGVAQKEYDDTVKGLGLALNSNDPAVKINTAEFEAGVKRAGEELQDRFRQIGDEFSNKLNKVATLFDQIGSAIGGKAGAAVSGVGGIAKAIGGFSDTQSDISGQFQDIFGKNSDLVKGIGNAVGGAVGGLKISESITTLSKTLGIKLNETGSKIGGALGGAFLGPLGAIGGSILGGLFGNLFSSPKWATASLTGTGDAIVSGNKGSLKSAATGASGSVQDGLAKIAAELGGAVGSFSVAIGQWDGKWRVNDYATNEKLHSNNFNSGPGGSLHDFGTDGQAAAIAYAIQNAIADGAITGLEPLIAKGLQVLSTDAAIQFGKDWTAAMADYKSIIDPIGAAVDAVLKPLNTLKDTMLEVGASSEDLAKFEDYRAKKLDQVLKEQTSGFQDILDQLAGDGGGVSSLDQLTKNLSAFDKFASDVKAGKAVDQSSYTDLVNKIMGEAGNVYGTNTSQYQDIVKLLQGVTTGALSNATTQFNNDVTVLDTDSTTQAVNAQTDQVTATIGISNDYLAQIAANTANMGSGSGGSGPGSINGVPVRVY